MPVRSTTARALVVAVAITALTVCGDRFEYTPPPDLEDPTIPPVSSGQCGDLPVTSVDDLYRPGGPAPGTVVAVEGQPFVPMVCTRPPADHACEPYDGDGECCGCWFDDECTYMIWGDDIPGNLCVFHPDFTCGFGGGCRPSCTPLGGDPGRRYRFVGTVREPSSPGIDVTAYCWVDT